MEPESIREIFVLSGRFCCATKLLLKKSIKKVEAVIKSKNILPFGVIGPGSSLGVSTNQLCSLELF